MAERRTADAFAKVNLGLIVAGLGSDGYHPLISLVQSISWADRVELVGIEEDAFTVDGMDASDDNLAWRAIEAVRVRGGIDGARWRSHLDKRIAVAAGLGGGSADAAAAPGAGRRLYGVAGRPASGTGARPRRRRAVLPDRRVWRSSRAGANE